MKVHVVTGPVVVLPDATTGKSAYYYQGAVLPDGLDKDRVADVVGLGLVEQAEVVDHPAPESSAGEPSEPGAVPDGTIDEVLAWVGDNPERARRALEAEQAAGKRKTLVDQLSKIAEQA